MDNALYTLITGASEGFGKSLAMECARRKMNLILVALPGAALHSLAEVIKLNYAVEVVIIAKDLCQENSCLELLKEVNALGLQVNILLNNAGIGSTGFFSDETIELYEKQIKLNILATTLITHLFLDMLKQNHPSHILNVGSLACFYPMPKKQVYGGTKSYIYYFSKSLRKELKKNNINVSVLCPGGMNTNPRVKQIINSGNYLSRVSSMEPEEVAPAAIHGLLNKREVIIPGKLNKFFLLLITLLPDFIKTILMNNTIKRLKPDQYSSDFVHQKLPSNQQPKLTQLSTNKSYTKNKSYTMNVN